MGRIRFVDQNDRVWWAGYDHPTGGYFADRDTDIPDPCQSCEGKGFVSEDGCFCEEAEAWESLDVQIGPFSGQFGLELEELELLVGEHGWTWDKNTRTAISQDYDPTWEPSPLQKYIRGMFRSEFPEIFD